MREVVWEVGKWRLGGGWGEVGGRLEGKFNWGRLGWGGWGRLGVGRLGEVGGGEVGGGWGWGGWGRLGWGGELRRLGVGR